jgi:predicted nucleotidyltransferase
MTDTLPNLRKQLPKRILEILKLVVTAAGELNIPVFVVGATARDIILGHVYNVRIRRATEDIDFGIAVESWSQYERLKQILVENGKFRADRKATHRLWHGSKTDEMKIDFVPYGGVESPAGQIAFPPDNNFVMNTSGFAEAYENSLIVNLTDDLQIRVVSLPGLAVLKFIAYNDKPHERRRDLEDILFLMKNYLEAGNEDRLYEDADLMADDSFDLRTVGARLLGRDMTKLLTSQTEEIISRHLSENNEGVGLANIIDAIKSSEKRLEDNFEDVAQMFQELKKGLAERLTV